MRILAVRRSPEFSPRHFAQDAAILETVGACMGAKGYQVDYVAEQELTALTDVGSYSCVFHMARRMLSYMRMSQWSCPIINPPAGVRNVAGSRELTMMLLQTHGIAVPTFWAYEPEEDEMFQCDDALQQMLPVWVKGMRATGVGEQDVVYAETALEADAHVMRMVMEGYADIVATAHLHGDLLKVYVVTDGESIRFVHRFYPQETAYTKYGREQHNDALHYYPVSDMEVEDTALRVARALDLMVFGMDCVVGSDGRLTVIDVNDWPSFTVCRTEAAEAIAALIDEYAQMRIIHK